MAEKRISLTQSKWSMMEFLWAEEPLTGWEDAALGETKDFLAPVYQGSFGLMVSALTQKQAFSREELDKLYGPLKGLEGENHA